MGKAEAARRPNEPKEIASKRRLSPTEPESRAAALSRRREGSAWIAAASVDIDSPVSPLARHAWHHRGAPEVAAVVERELHPRRRRARQHREGRGRHRSSMADARCPRAATLRHHERTPCPRASVRPHDSRIRGNRARRADILSHAIRSFSLRELRSARARARGQRERPSGGRPGVRPSPRRDAPEPRRPARRACFGARTSARLVRTLRRPGSSPRDARRGLLRELIGLVTFELAILGELPFEVRLQRFPGRGLSMAGGLSLDVASDTHVVVLRYIREHARARTAGGDARGRPGRASPGRATRRACVARFYAIAGGIVLCLALEDNNPLALDEAHPDKSGNAVDLGGASAERMGHGASERVLPRRDVPPGPPRRDGPLPRSGRPGRDVYDTRHLSASYQEALWHRLFHLSLHPNPMTMTEALIHEFQHNKLNALFELDDVLENAFCAALSVARSPRSCARCTASSSRCTRSSRSPGCTNE